MELQEGFKLQNGKYVIHKKLGQGGFGITYLAWNVPLQRKVAVKEFFLSGSTLRDVSDGSVVIPTEHARQDFETYKPKFIKEARLIASLNAPGIIKIHDVFEEKGTAYYVMDFLEGGSVRDMVRSRGHLDEATATRLIRKVAESLRYVHAANILHLDIKPDNIMLDGAGSPVIIDFGISKHYDSNGRQTTRMQKGYSPGYSPLEQYGGGSIEYFKAATDIYSLGATLYYMLTGQVPPEPQEIMAGGQPDISSCASPAMCTVVGKMMAVAQKNRYQSADEVLAALPVGDKTPSRPAAPVGTAVISRESIEELIELGDYRSAYEQCIANVTNGYDKVYNSEKAKEIKKILGRNNLLGNIKVFLMLIGSIILLGLIIALKVMY